MRRCRAGLERIDVFHDFLALVPLLFGEGVVMQLGMIDLVYDIIDLRVRELLIPVLMHVQSERHDDKNDKTYDAYRTADRVESHLCI